MSALPSAVEDGQKSDDVRALKFGAPCQIFVLGQWRDAVVIFIYDDSERIEVLIAEQLPDPFGRDARFGLAFDKVRTHPPRAETSVQPEKQERPI